MMRRRDVRARARYALICTRVTMPRCDFAVFVTRCLSFLFPACRGQSLKIKPACLARTETPQVDGRTARPPLSIRCVSIRDRANEYRLRDVALIELACNF
jgi:hypothetical protein